MATVSIPQALAYARQAGFTGASQVIIVAIAIAESGLDSNAKNLKDPNGGSWGVLQINGAHFQSGTTTQQCALNPPCAFQFAFGLSKQGRDFHDWGAYTNNSYAQFLPQVQSISGNKTPANTTSACYTGSDSCWVGICDGTPVQKIPACNPLNIKCFDPAQCAAYVASGFKVNQAGPAMSQTGPIAAGMDLGTQVRNAILGPVESWLPGALERVGLFLFALILIIAGFVLIK